MAVTDRILVPCDSRTYEVLLGSNILDELGKHVKQVIPKATRVCVISDSHVAPLYGARCVKSLEDQGFASQLITFCAGEASKNMTTLAHLLEEVAALELSRDDAVVALGGGVTGDIAGLVAALYLRGIAVVQVPTSLLAMVDSSVGGKCAVDLTSGKNLAGAFWQPRLVIADTAVLSTLETSTFIDGCAEAIKHGILKGEELFLSLTDKPLFTYAVQDPALAQILAQNIAVKRDIVAADEKEQGKRALLNLGHTIGHAVEAASKFSLGHGASVAIGLCAMARASAAFGWCTTTCATQIIDAFEAYKLPTKIPYTTDELMPYISHDKKRRGDTVQIVALEGIGNCTLKRLTLPELRELIDVALRSQSNPLPSDSWNTQNHLSTHHKEAEYGTN